MRVRMVVPIDRQYGDATDQISGWCADRGIEPEVHEWGTPGAAAVVELFQHHPRYYGEDFTFPQLLMVGGEGARTTTYRFPTLRDMEYSYPPPLSEEAEADLAMEAVWANGRNTGDDSQTFW